MSKLKKIVIGLLILVLVIPATACGYLYFKLHSMYQNDSEASKIVNETNFNKVDGIENILLVGIDARNLNEPSRSDSMMILTVDGKHKDIKLTSLARDTYVDIPGHGKQKLTHAYAYGGINLLLETIEKNFQLDLNHYAIVNFFGFVDIIDAIGGVQVDIQSSELKELNTYITNGQAIDKVAADKKVETISEPGVHNLNGYQALAYARIRHNDSAYGRDNRQRKIIEATLKKMSKASPLKYPSILDSILPSIKTDMKPTNILGLATKVLSIGDSNIKTLEFPIPDDNQQGYSKGGIINSETGWVLQFNPEKNLPVLHDFIFDDVMFNGPQQ
ncbi:LCP family protein [Paraclostridium sordellii]